MTPDRREELSSQIELKCLTAYFENGYQCTRVERSKVIDLIIAREDALLASHKEMIGRFEKPLKEIYQRMGDDPYEKIRCWGPLMYHAIEKSLAIIHSAKGKV